jgi:hypothetical protein
MAIFVNKICLVLPCAGILLQLPSLAGAIWYVNEGIEQFGNIEAYPAPVRTCSQLSFARTHVDWHEGNHAGDPKERRQCGKSDGESGLLFQRRSSLMFSIHLLQSYCILRTSGYTDSGTYCPHTVEPLSQDY